MDPICSLRSIDETPPHFKDFRIVPKIQIVDHVTSKPTIFYRWDPRNRAAENINHCFIGVLHRHVQRRYVVWVKVKRTYVYSLSVTKLRIV